MTSGWHARRAGVLVRAALFGSGARLRVASTAETATPRTGLASSRRGRSSRSLPSSPPGPARFPACASAGSSRSPSLPSPASPQAAAAATDETETEPDGRVGGRLLQRCHRLDGRAADHHAAVLRRLEPLAGRAPVGGRGRQEAATQSLIDDLKDLGTPDTESGRGGQELARQPLHDARHRDVDDRGRRRTAFRVIADLPTAVTAPRPRSSGSERRSHRRSDDRGRRRERRAQVALDNSPDCADIT